MIDKMLLGFLMDGDKTGYDIKKYMENSTNFFFNTSFGRIYPVFKKLEQDKMVKVNETVKNGKLNKSYSITQKGKDTFLAWLKVKPEISRIREEALLKIFFFDNLEAEHIKSQLEGYVDELYRYIEVMQSIKSKLKKYKIDKWKLETLDFGLDFYEYIAKRYHQMLDHLKE